MQPTTQKLHPILEVFRGPGGMFDVEPSEMDLNIGRRGKLKDPGQRGDGTVHQQEFTVVAVQKDYRGELNYRCCVDGDNFGYLASPERVIFLTDEDTHV
jgi:hypothetical protein